MASAIRVSNLIDRSDEDEDEDLDSEQELDDDGNVSDGDDEDEDDNDDNDDGEDEDDDADDDDDDDEEEEEEEGEEGEEEVNEDDEQPRRKERAVTVTVRAEPPQPQTTEEQRVAAPAVSREPDALFAPPSAEDESVSTYGRKRRRVDLFRDERIAEDLPAVKPSRKASGKKPAKAKRAALLPAAASAVLDTAALRAAEKALRKAANKPWKDDPDRAMVAADKVAASAPETIEAAALFQRFFLSKLIKENHRSYVLDLQLNRCDPSLAHYFVTVASHQVNIYDNAHMGNHLDLLSQLASTDISPSSCCWLKTPRDAYAVVGDNLGFLRVISVAGSREVLRLSTDNVPVLHVESVPAFENVVCSLLRDGSVVLWHVRLKATVWRTKVADAASMVFHRSGQRFAVGRRDGTLLVVAVPEDVQAQLSSNATTLASSVGKADASSAQELLRVTTGSFAITCLRYTAGGSIMYKTSGGLIGLMDESGNNTTVVQLPSWASSMTNLDLSADGRYFCIGTQHGSIAVFSTLEGVCIAELSHKKLKGKIIRVSFGLGDRELIATTSEGMIGRYDYATAEQWEEWSKTYGPLETAGT